MISAPKRIVLIGPSGSGKSALATRLAALLNYQPIDTDERIVDQVGMPIGEFFRRFGEPAFRALESAVVAEACCEETVVIATGGGVVLSPTNWAHMRPDAAIIGLSASPETLADRMQAQSLRDETGAERPLLAGDVVTRLRDLIEARREHYSAADVTIDTEGLEEDAVAGRVLSEIDALQGSGRIPFATLQTPVGRSDIFVSPGVRHQLGTMIGRRWPSAGRVWIVSDEHVSERWSASLMGNLRDSGMSPELLAVAPGEGSKRMSEVERLCDAMTRGGVTRRDVVVALGGGVVGDLAGFVASIVLRGLPLVQLPTSLLAMVDSSVGGKTGVNLPAGKNLVGAFYQPGIVAIDPDFLTTLPQAEFRSGMAEVIKHSLIQPSTPIRGNDLAQQLAQLALDPIPAAAMVDVLRLNVAIKRSVVQADERESGLRMILNFGHTAGHAIEADGYRYRHGEAVALGMVVASRIALRLERVDRAYVDDVEQRIARAALPTRMTGSAEHMIGRLSSDKKNVDGALNWILPRADGLLERVTGVSIKVVRDALRECGAT